MKRTARTIAVFTMLAILVFNLSACNGQEFDAAGYVKAYLDAVYHQEYEAYAEFAKQSPEEVEKSFNQDTEENIKSVHQDMELSEQELADYSSIIAEIKMNAKYEVKEAEKTDDDNYVVTVNCYPVDTYVKFNNGFQAKIDETYADATEVPTEADALKFTMDFMRECGQDVTYGDPVTVEVHVERDENEEYFIPPDDSEAIELKLMPNE